MRRRPRSPPRRRLPSYVMTIVAIAIALSIRNTQARPFHSVSLPLLSWRAGRIRLPKGLHGSFRRRHLPKHGAFIPRIIPRGGSSAGAATTAAYADFFDDGMYSDSGGGGGGELPQSPSGHNQQPYEQSYEQQQYQHEQYPSNQQQSRTVAEYNQQQYQQEKGVMPLQYGHDQDQVAAHAAYIARVASSSRMNCYTLSLALRYTCEINRKLRHGTGAPRAYFNCNDSNCRHLHMDLVEGEEGSPTSSSQQQQPANRQQPWELQHQGHQHQSGVSAPVHHAQEWNPPIRRPDPESEPLRNKKAQLSVFHAPSPRRGYGKPLTGAERWGIELEQFLKEICEKMDCSDNVTALVMARALIYLDRACNVETERQAYHGSTHWSADVPPGYSSTASPCPAIIPRTVHRLILTAIVLSCRAMRDQAGPEYDGAYCENFVQFGITPSSLSAMEAAMRDALGIEGLYVDEHRLVHYLLTWGQTFTHDQHETKEDDSSSGSSASDEEDNVLSSDDSRIDDTVAGSPEEAEL